MTTETIQVFFLKQWRILFSQVVQKYIDLCIYCTGTEDEGSLLILMSSIIIFRYVSMIWAGTNVLYMGKLPKR